MRLPVPVHKVLRRRNIAVTHYDRTQEQRRQRLLSSLGIQTVVDVGANAGQYCLTLREHGYRGDLISFEPLFSAYEKLTRAAGKDGRWLAERMAVSSSAGELTLHVGHDSQFTSAAELSEDARDGAMFRQSAQAVGTEVAPMDTLDALLDRLAPKEPLGVKIDVQGHESAVFEGAPETLGRAQFLEFEMSTREIYKGQELFPDMIARAARLGFVIALAESIWVMPSGRGYQLNGIFVKEGD